jgi:hypothetical protein
MYLYVAPAKNIVSWTNLDDTRIIDALFNNRIQIVAAFRDDDNKQGRRNLLLLEARSTRGLKFLIFLFGIMSNQVV